MNGRDPDVVGGGHRTLPIALAACGGLLMSGLLPPAAAEGPASPGVGDAPSPARPLFRELWVPEDDLPAVLAKMPEAVSLTRQQYLQLAHDAARQDARRHAEAALPAAAVLGPVTMDARTEDNVLVVAATVPVEVLREGWVEVPLDFRSQHLAQVEVDGDMALRSPVVEAPAPEQAGTVSAPPPTGSPGLIVRGRGPHEAVLTWRLPSDPEAGGSRFVIPPLSGVASTLTLAVPDGFEVESTLPFRAVPGGVQFAFAAGKEPGEVRLLPMAGPAGGRHVVQTCNYRFTADVVRLGCDMQMMFSAPVGGLPPSLQIPVPDGVSVREVAGAELASWDMVAGGVALVFAPGERRETGVTVSAEMGTLDGGDEATVDLPLLRADDVYRAGGTLAVRGRDGVAVREIDVEGEGVEAEGPSPSDDGGPAWAGRYKFATLPEQARIRLERIRPETVATVDALFALRRDAVSIDRAIVFTPRAGELFGARLNFGMPGEEVVSLRATDGRQFESRPVPGGLAVAWDAGVAAGQSAQLALATRWVPAGWDGLDEGAPVGLAIAPLTLTEMPNTSGYVAVRHDGALAVETVDETGLERRDGRTTPVAGALAWFREDDFSLGLEVRARQPEFTAAVDAYALPLFSTLEIEGVVRLDVRFSPLEVLRVQLAPEVAELFRLDSPMVASSAFDAAAGEWAFRFRKGLSGSEALRFQMTLPLEVEGDGERRFECDLPTLTLPDAKRVEGTWMVEANTDTELDFTAEGLDAIDTLRVPHVPGYEPRHRIIGAFAYRGAAHALALSGVRHAPADPLATVIDRMSIDTVVNESGTERHEVWFGVRSAGAQFLDVGLPAGAAVWSLVVGGEAVKPVVAGAGSVRVALPHDGARGTLLPVRLVYEVPAEPWDKRGQRTLHPPRLDDEIPILESRWALHLPEDFSYHKFDTNMVEAEPGTSPPLAGHVWNHVRAGLGTGGPHPPHGSEPAVLAEHPPAHFDTELDKEPWDIEGGPNDARVHEILSTIRIPKIAFDDTTVQEAVDFLRLKVAEADQADGARIPIEIHPGARDDTGFGTPAGERQVTLSLTDVPLGQALKYVTDLAGLRYRIADGRIAIIPATDAGLELESRTFRVPPTFLSAAGQAAAAGDPFADPAAAPESGLAQGLSSKDVLSAAGVTFPEGASAYYDKLSSRLIVRNTANNLDIISNYVEPLRVGGADADAGAVDPFSDAPEGAAAARVAGLRPLQFTLPGSGKEIVLTGDYAAAPVTFGYTAWETEIRFGWIWIAAGAGLFFVLGRRRPLLVALSGAVVLTALALAIEPAVETVNAVLLGWIAAAVALLVYRGLRRAGREPKPKEVGDAPPA